MKGVFCCLNDVFCVLLGIKYRFMRFMITIIKKFICIALFRTSVKKSFPKKQTKKIIKIYFRRI